MNDPFLRQQISQVSSRFEIARNMVARSRSLIELVQALNCEPSVPAYLRMLSEMRREQQQLRQAAERQAKGLVNKSLEHLRSIAGTDQYSQMRIQFLGDVRRLYPKVAIVAREAEREFRALEASVAASSASDKPEDGESASGQSQPTERG